MIPESSERAFEEAIEEGFILDVLATTSPARSW
jgi:hypothetical protein